MLEIPNANILWDPDWATLQLDDFNANLFWVAGDRMLREMFHAPRPGWARAMVEAVDSLMKTRLPKEDRRNILPGIIKGNWERIWAVLRKIGSADIRETPQRTFDALKPILKLFLDAEGTRGRQYSFATKFLHWASAGHLPIMDGFARGSICSCQDEWRRVEHAVTRESLLTKNPRQDRREDYKNWMFFYGHLLRKLHGSEYGRSLIERDCKAQHTASGGRKEFVLGKNTLVRILDKIFWTDGRAQGAKKERKLKRA